MIKQLGKVKWKPRGAVRYCHANPFLRRRIMNISFLSRSFFALTFFLSFFPLSAQAIPITITSGETPSGSYEALGPISYAVYNIGLYEPDNEHGWRLDGNGNLVHYQERGTATIYIDDQNGIPAALALGSYEPTDWILTGPGANAIDHILLYGYSHHTINGMSNAATVDERTYENGGSYIYSSGGYNWPNASVAGIESIIGSPITSFVGAYSASGFFIGANTSGIPGSSAPVPEPTTMLLFSTGLVGFAGNLARRKWKA